MDANKKLVQQQITQDTGKIVLLKDLSNLAASAKNSSTKNDLNHCVKTLMEKYGEYMYHFHVYLMNYCIPQQKNDCVYHIWRCNLPLYLLLFLLSCKLI